MALITWSERYALGIASVDHEHKELIDLINRLYAELRQDRAASRVRAFLEEIHARIAAHFALEERVMRETGYPEFEAHKAEHERLLDSIRDIMDRYEDGGYHDMDDELARHLHDWFAIHFRTMDARFHGVVGPKRQDGGKEPPEFGTADRK